eukprot:TRINITY_DN1858_c0_g1_i4.p1 TRINITY_DN1858_c0_g1~~TRINITY_DN1858_c0_g1_i4.p1  ORF type:complete len:1599 (-),score=234.12 TRINITY_DN1858_c0_g1_i4:43-4839(-)
MWNALFRCEFRIGIKLFGYYTTNLTSLKVRFDQPRLINIDGYIVLDFKRTANSGNVTIFDGIPQGRTIYSSIGYEVEVANSIEPRYMCWDTNAGLGYILSVYNFITCNIPDNRTQCLNTPITPVTTHNVLGQCNGRQIITRPYGVISDHVGNGRYLRDTFCEWDFRVLNASNYTLKFFAYEVYGSVVFHDKKLVYNFDTTTPSKWDFKSSVDPTEFFRDALNRAYFIDSPSFSLNLTTMVPTANLISRSLDSLAGFTLFYYTNDSPPPLCSPNTAYYDLTKFSSYHVYPFLKQYFNSGPSDLTCSWIISHSSDLPFGVSVKFFQPATAISSDDYFKRSTFGGDLVINRIRNGLNETLARYNRNTIRDITGKSVNVIKDISEQYAYTTWEDNYFEMYYDEVYEIRFTLPANLRTDGFDVEFYKVGSPCKGSEQISLDSSQNYVWLNSNILDQASYVLKAGTICSWKISIVEDVYIYFKEISTSSDVITITANTKYKQINKQIVGQGSILPSLEVIRAPLLGDGFITISYAAAGGGGRGFQILIATKEGLKSQLKVEVLDINNNNLFLNFSNIANDQYYLYDTGPGELNAYINGITGNSVTFYGGGIAFKNYELVRTQNNIDGAILVKLNSFFDNNAVSRVKMSTPTDFKFAPLINKFTAVLNGTNNYAILNSDHISVYKNGVGTNYPIPNYGLIKSTYGIDFVSPSPGQYKIMLATEKLDSTNELIFFNLDDNSTTTLPSTNYVARSAGLSSDGSYLESFSFSDIAELSKYESQSYKLKYINFFNSSTYFLKRIQMVDATFYIVCNKLGTSLEIFARFTSSSTYEFTSMNIFYDIPCWFDQNMDFSISNDWKYLAMSISNSSSRQVILTSLFPYSSRNIVVIPSQDPVFGHQILFSFDSAQLIVSGQKVYVYDLAKLDVSNPKPTTYFPNRYVYPSINFYPSSNPFELSIGLDQIYVLYDVMNSSSKNLSAISSAPEGYMIVTKSDGTIDTIMCPSGTYKDTAGFHSCLFCPSGKYQPLKGQTSCLDCNITSFCPFGSSFEGVVQDSVVSKELSPKFETGESAGVDNAIWPALYGQYFGLAVLLCFLIIIAFALILITPIMEDCVDKDRVKKFLRKWDADPMTYYDSRDMEFKSKGSMKSTLLFTAKAILLFVSYIFMIYFYFQYTQYIPGQDNLYLNNARSTILQPLNVNQDGVVNHIQSQGFIFTYYLYGSSFFDCNSSRLFTYSEGCKIKNSKNSCFNMLPTRNELQNGTCIVQMALAEIALSPNSVFVLDLGNSIFQKVDIAITVPPKTIYPSSSSGSYSIEDLGIDEGDTYIVRETSVTQSFQATELNTILWRITRSFELTYVIQQSEQVGVNTGIDWSSHVIISSTDNDKFNDVLNVSDLFETTSNNLIQINFSKNQFYIVNQEGRVNAAGQMFLQLVLVTTAITGVFDLIFFVWDIIYDRTKRFIAFLQRKFCPPDEDDGPLEDPKKLSKLQKLGIEKDSFNPFNVTELHDFIVAVVKNPDEIPHSPRSARSARSARSPRSVQSVQSARSSDKESTKDDKSVEMSTKKSRNEKSTSQSKKSRKSKQSDDDSNSGKSNDSNNSDVTDASDATE